MNAPVAKPGRPDLRIVGGTEPPRPTCDQFTFSRVEGKLVVYHNGEECSVAEAAATVALIAREFYGADFVSLPRLLSKDELHQQHGTGVDEGTVLAVAQVFGGDGDQGAEAPDGAA